MDERWNSILTLAEEWAAAAATSVISSSPGAITKSWAAGDAFVKAVEELRAAVDVHKEDDAPRVEGRPLTGVEVTIKVKFPPKGDE